MSGKLYPVFPSELPDRKYRPFPLLCAILCLCLAACTPPTVVPTPTPAPQRSPTATVTQFIFPPTFTPTEAGPPTLTNTPGPSRTPVPTETLGPTLPPSPTPLVEILTASAADGPFVTSRLLFLDDFLPRIWDPGTGGILSVGPGILPENFDRISLSRGGAYIAVSSPGAAGPVIVIYNRFTEEIVRSIPAEGESLFDLAISPNGLWLAYITSTELQAVQPTATPLPSGTPTATPEAGTTPTGTPIPTATPSSGSVLEREIYFIDLIEAGGPRFVGDCTLNCTGITWSPGSDLFVWGQANGLWGVVPGPAGDPELLLEPFVSGISGGVQTTDSYLPGSISPSSRFVLVRKGIRTGTVLSVLDRTTGTLENVPGTGAYTGVGTGLTWLSDDSLFIARPGIAGLGLLPAGELWGLPGTGGSLFVKLAEFPFPGSVDARPDAPVELPDGRIGFSLVNLRDGNDAAVNGLYILDPVSGELERVNYLPLVLVDELLWLPDLSGALVLSESRLLFVPVGFGPVYSMRLLLGTDACCFRWIP
jgi:hypothetical protein